MPNAKIDLDIALAAMDDDSRQRYRRERARMDDRLRDIFSPVSRQDQERIITVAEIKRTDSFCDTCIECGELRVLGNGPCSRHGPQTATPGYMLLAFIHILEVNGTK